MISAIIDDIRNGRRYHFVFNDNDFSFIEKSWNKVDQALVNLSNVPLFKNVTRWAELKPIHFKNMISLNLTSFLELPVPQQSNLEHPVTKSLNMVIMGLIKCLQDNGEFTLELLKIKSMGVGDILVDFQATLTAEDNSMQDNTDFLQLVVDNSDEE